MKKSLFTLLILLALFAALVLQACAPASDSQPVPTSPVAEVQPASTSIAAVYLTTDFSDAASVRNQLALGTLELAGTANAVTPEQAKGLLPLWQALLNLTGTDTVAEAELSALQNQINETMTADQMQAIASMQITNAQLSTFYSEYGIVLPTLIPGVTKVPGGNSGLSQAEKEAARATAQALGTPVGTDSGSGTGQVSRTLLFEKVIEYLMEAAGQ